MVSIHLVLPGYGGLCLLVSIVTVFVYPVSAEAALLKKLTKINRMDIVHLMEPKMNRSEEEETSSHTYAEIEETIALDHSEGTPPGGRLTFIQPVWKHPVCPDSLCSRRFLCPS